MSVLVDTNVLVDALRGLPEALRFLVELRASGPVRASVISRAELRAGSGGASSQMDRFLSRIDWIPVTEAVADAAGALSREFRPRNPGIDPGDFLIAATAFVLNLALATRNVKHFPMFQGLRPAY